jgi:acetoacetate decarboxylase
MDPHAGQHGLRQLYGIRAGHSLPVKKVIGAHHFIADLTLPYGRVVFDYNRAD